MNVIILLMMRFGVGSYVTLGVVLLIALFEIILVTALTVIFGFHWSVIVLAVFVCYIIKNIIYALFRI